MSLANDLAKSKYRPHHRNAKGLAAAGILVRGNSPLWLTRHSFTTLTVTPCPWGSADGAHTCSLESSKTTTLDKDVRPSVKHVA